MPVAVVVSRDQAQAIPGPVVSAVLRVDAATLPAWLGVDLGPRGLAVVHVHHLHVIGEVNAGPPSGVSTR